MSNKKKYQELIKQGLNYYLENKFQEACECYEEAFKIDASIEDAITLGFIYVDLEKYPQAEEIFNKVLKVAEHSRAYYGLGTLYDNLGLQEKAINAYEGAINIDPNHDVVYFDCAYLYDDLGNTSKAIEYYQKAIALNPKYFWAYLNMGSIYEKQNRNEEALECFIKAYEIDKNQPMVCYNLGVIYGKMRNYDLALQFYLEELNHENYFHLTYYNLGLLYKDAYKDYQRAKNCYLKGLEDDKDNYNIWYNLGCLYAIMNDYDNAFDCFIYLYYKKRELLEYLKKDDELQEFRNSLQYQKIMGNNL